MINEQFDGAENIKTIEQYVAFTLASMLSIQTLASIQIGSLKVGIFDESESQMCAAIISDLRTVMQRCHAQVDNVLERSSTTKEEILNEIKKKFGG